MKPRMNQVSPGTGALPQGRVPTTREWNEFEARLDKRPVRFISAGEQKTGRAMKRLPIVTDDQANASGPQMMRALAKLVGIIAERGLLTDLVVAHAWLSAIKAIELASRITPEAVAAYDSPADQGESDAVAGVGETTAAEASRNKPTPGG